MSDWMDAHALADGELSASEAAAAQERLNTCKQTKAEYEAIMAVRETVRRACQEQPNPDLWDRCRNRLDEIDRLKRTERFVGKYAWVLCGLFFIAIFSAAIMNRIDPTRSMRSTDVAGMFSSLSPFQTEIAPHAIPQVLKEDIGRAPVALRSNDLQVVGMARGVVNGHPVVRFELKDPAGFVTMLAIGKANRLDVMADDTKGMHEWKAGDRNCVSWVDRDVVMVVAAERPMAEVRQVAQSISIQ